MSRHCFAALSQNNRHNLFSVAAKTCENLAILIRICSTTGIKQKLRWHSTTAVGERGAKDFFMNRLVKVDSNVCLSRDNIGNTSVAFNCAGMHLAWSNSKMVSSEAALLILQYMRWRHEKRAFTLVKEYFRMRPLGLCTGSLRVCYWQSVRPSVCP